MISKHYRVGALSRWEAGERRAAGSDTVRGEASQRARVGGERGPPRKRSRTGPVFSERLSSILLSLWFVVVIGQVLRRRLDLRRALYVFCFWLDREDS
jgi:hypothetical protein